MILRRSPIQRRLIRKRLKCFCCREWGISPVEFERQAAAREFTYEDVNELLRQVTFEESRDGVLRALFGELIAEEERIARMNEAMDKMWEVVRAKQAQQNAEREQADV